MERPPRSPHDGYGGLGAARGQWSREGAVSELPNLPFLSSASIPSRGQDRLELTTIFDIWKLDVKRSLHTCGTFLQVTAPAFSEEAPCFGCCVRICPRALELAPLRDVEFLFPAWQPTCFDIPCGLIGQTLQSSASDGIRTAGT
jgi:hypothetical protein